MTSERSPDGGSLRSGFAQTAQLLICANMHWTERWKEDTPKNWASVSFNSKPNVSQQHLWEPRRGFLDAGFLISATLGFLRRSEATLNVTAHGRASAQSLRPGQQHRHGEFSIWQEHPHPLIKTAQFCFQKYNPDILKNLCLLYRGVLVLLPPPRRCPPNATKQRLSPQKLDVSNRTAACCTKSSTPRTGRVCLALRSWAGTTCVWMPRPTGRRTAIEPQALGLPVGVRSLQSLFCLTLPPGQLQMSTKPSRAVLQHEETAPNQKLLPAELPPAPSGHRAAPGSSLQGQPTLTARKRTTNTHTTFASRSVHFPNKCHVSNTCSSRQAFDYQWIRLWNIKILPVSTMQY